MSTRNTPVLQEIIDVLFTDLDEQATALNQLEHYFHDRLLVDAGNVATVGSYAEQLRLQITEDERGIVLDYIGEQKMVVVTIDIVEAAINELLGQDRFIEPWTAKKDWLSCRSFFLAVHHSPSLKISDIEHFSRSTICSSVSTVMFCSPISNRCNVESEMPSLRAY